MGGGASTVRLKDISTPDLQTRIVRKAIAEGISVVFCAPNLDDPRNGVWVEIPMNLMATYKCKKCGAITNPKFYRDDVLCGLSLTKPCSCGRKARIIFIGPDMEVPLVDFGDAAKKGLEKFL